MKRMISTLNLVKTESGDFIIDGQSGRVDDLSSVKGRSNFARCYGHNNGLNIVQIYHTGSALRAVNVC